jgi:hypothetical protein
MENENKEMEQPQGIETFNETEFFDNEISPKLEELLKLCHARRIPILIHAIKEIREDRSTSCHLSSINNRNGQAVADLASCSKILSGKKNPLKSLALMMLAERE